MRPPMLSLFLVAAAMLGETQAASAQCLRGGSIDCRYSNYEQCRRWNYRGICVKSPYYQ
jgi:hypothetical protein